MEQEQSQQQAQRLQYQPIQTNQNVVVVSSDQLQNSQNTVSQFSGLMPVDGARLVNIVSNDNVPMLFGNIAQGGGGGRAAAAPTVTPTATIATPMQGIFFRERERD